jgi:hypothetical protein
VVGVRDARSGREAGAEEIGAGPSEELRRGARDDDLIVTRPPVHRTAEISHVDQVVAVAELQLDAVVLARQNRPPVLAGRQAPVSGAPRSWITTPRGMTRTEIRFGSPGAARTISPRVSWSPELPSQPQK